VETRFKWIYDHPSLDLKLQSVYTANDGEPAVRVKSGDEQHLKRVKNLPISLELYHSILETAQYIGVTQEFKNVISYFKTPEGETPAGFRAEFRMAFGGLVEVDLVRDIAFDKNCTRRPTNLLYSVDSANPYEVRHFSNLVANLTCNPGIIYDLFINNPKANVDGKFKTRDEVMAELGRVLGPGSDISVELNNPFEEDFSKILEEAEKFKEMLSPYRVVIKVPHTGTVNSRNVNELLTGDGSFQRRFDEGATEDLVRGHNLALKLQERGFRINFTLMFEPYQTNLALQARPYFINAFIRHRLKQSEQISKRLNAYMATEDPSNLEALKKDLMKFDFLSPKDESMSLLEVEQLGWDILKYRQFDDEGSDGLDSVRHSLRCLRNANMPDTRLIICSMEGFFNYKDIDKLLAEPEFADINDRVVITTDPVYLAQQTSTNLVTSYQRRFMKAAQGQA
jgi:hypothetical protein